MSIEIGRLNVEQLPLIVDVSGSWVNIDNDKKNAWCVRV